MAYRLVISEIVDLDLQDYFDYIVTKEKAKPPAIKWYSEVMKAIRQVCDYPEKHKKAPEFADSPMDIRESHRHSHRIVFRIDKADQTVYVLRVFHVSRKPLSPKDIEDK